LWDKVVFKLSEQGTQRGLMLLVPMILISLFGIDKDTAVDVVTGVIALASAHDIITEG
jgi:Na+/serine symporter